MLKFGAVGAVWEDYHAEQGLPFIESLLQDLRFALRQMRKSPGFTLLTGLILTLGIWINTGIFSLVYHVFLEPLPFPNNSTILVSYRFWKSQLGGDPCVIGRVLQIGGSASTIVGVVPPLPDLFPYAEVWPTLPTRPGWDYMQWRKNKFLTVMGRLKPGVTVTQAQDELTGVLRRFRRAGGCSRAVDSAEGRPGWVSARPVANRFGGRGAGSTGGMNQRRSSSAGQIGAEKRLDGRSTELGASLKRLRQQLLTKGLVLTVVACSPGVFAAWLAPKILPRLPALRLPRLEGIHLNGAALLITAGIAVLTTLLFGWAPSLMFSRPALASSLRSGRTNTGKPHRRSFSTLIVAEIACSVVLSICAALLLKSNWRVAHVDSGFEPDHMMTTYLRTTYFTPEGGSFWRDVLEGVGSLPGVRATLADCTPGRAAAIATLVFTDRPKDTNRAAPAEGC